MSRRTYRVNALLREELSRLLREDLRDPRVGGLVSVTAVDVSPDLRRAIAHISVLGTDAERVSTMAALNHAAPFLRHELAQRVKLRYTPALEFMADDSLERGQQLTDLMRETARERGDAL